MAGHRNAVLIDLTVEGERAYDEELRQIVDLTQDGDDSHWLPAQHEQPLRGRRGPRKQRNAPLETTHRPVQSYTVGNIEFRVQNCYELTRPIGEFWQAQFVEVKQIWVGASGNEVLLRGLPYARNGNMHGRFELKVNEVCQILEIDQDDNRPDEQQAMIEVRPDDILTVRSLHKTNTAYHSARNCRYGNDPYWKGLDMEKEKKKRHLQDFAPLTCRWKMRFHYHNATYRRFARAFGTAVLHLAEGDIDDQGYRTSDAMRRKTWLKRHPISTGGQSLAQSQRQYTFGDAFCGCGGATSGARQALLQPKIAIDFWEPACDSHQRNFPEAILFRQDIHDFITRTEFDILPYIDILHISPPCQFYSPAKVNPGKDDAKNEVALWACGELIERIRPRVFTMEQTYGLVATRFTEHFNKLIHCFTMSGYSVQWRERVELNQYGLPQDRKRLIIIGAAPGEQLPTWPAPTHGNGRKPWVTEAMAIGRFPRNVTLHDIRNARHVDGIARNPNLPLPRTIVCSGAQGLIHYNGQRDYTLRELATLQGFPLDHVFVGPSRTVIRKQIGNAFPASVCKVFFQSIREFLERQDRIRRSAALPSPLVPGSSPNDRRRPRVVHGAQGPRLPGYSSLNGDLDEDQALQIAMRKSRHENRPQPPRVVIEIYDSDDDDDLPAGLDCLSVDRSQPSPPNTGESAHSQQTASPWSCLSTPNQPVFDTQQHRAPSSAASSFTMDNSPSPSPSPCPSPRQRSNHSPSPESSPSPCQQQSRKRRSDDPRESAQKRARGERQGTMVDKQTNLAKKDAERQQGRR